MKYFAIALCVVAAAILIDAEPPMELMAKMPEYIETCKKNTGSTDEDIAPLMKHEIPPKKNAQCFMACMKKSVGMMTADNKMDVPKIKKFTEMFKDDKPDLYKKVNEIVDNCSKEVVVDADECVTAVRMMECCKKYSDKLDIKESLGMM